MILEVLIATYSPEGIRRVAAMKLPQLPNVRYLVSWQMSEGEPILPEVARREDIRVMRFNEKGLCKNRNHLLQHATGDVLLMADDDLHYEVDGLRAVLSVFENNKELDLAQFKYEGADGKQYPEEECSLTPEPKGLWTSSIEIALRRNGRGGRLRFDERFGLNSEYLQAGEEEIFMHEARNNGLNMRFYPITIAVHPATSTGLREAGSPGVLAAIGASYYLRYGKMSAFLRCVVRSYRIWKKGESGFLHNLRHQLKGMQYIARSERER